MPQLDNAEEFVKTLAEVDLLLAESENSGPGTDHPDEQRVSVMNKVALLLLTGKFEAFMESAVEDFMGALNSLRASRRHIPERVLIEHSVRAIHGIETKLSARDFADIRTVFLDLARNWSDGEPCIGLKVSSKFNYGKHGAKEAERLYSRIGIDDLFERICVEDSGEVYEGDNPKTLDISGLVDSLTYIRNNILHQDATPQLTADSLRKQSAALRTFATKLIAALQKMIDEVEDASNSEGAAGAGRS